MCFDVDSTVLGYEGIDVLADYHGCGADVSAYTTQAMNGQCTFQDALAARLNIIQPKYDILMKCINQHPLQLTDGIRELIGKLHARGTLVYLVSGGFKQMIEPAARALHIPSHNIYANVLIFDDTPPYQYIDFDHSQPTSQSGGKCIAIQHIKHANNLTSNDIIMIGDGITDLEARVECGMFIGYGGIAVRAGVLNGADLFIKHWNQIIPYV